MAKKADFAMVKRVDRADLLNTYRNKLAIDREDLQTCLAEQARLFYEVANAHVMAIAERDQFKLDIEELHAALDQSIRKEAEEKEEKTTESGIQQRIKDDRDMRELKGQHLEAGKQADEWGALKEAFHQRSYMMRELVALTLRQMDIENVTSSTERLASDYKAKLGDDAIKRVGKLRRDSKDRPFLVRRRANRD